MRKILIAVLFIVTVFFIIISNLRVIKKTEKPAPIKLEEFHEITGHIKQGDTLFDIFKQYKLDLGDLFKLKEASADIHKLRYLYPGRPYKIVIDSNNQINSFTYWINDDNILTITRTETGFNAEKIQVKYEKKVHHLGGVINDNLISCMERCEEDILLALKLSDIFAWDIDFTTDLRKGDTFKMIVEGLYLDGEFKKYGAILSAEFVNNRELHQAYRFEHNGDIDYYDADGNSLRRAFLKAPLSFRRISSGFSKRRFHPILKIYRPHLGVDYAAPIGTPVSAVGDGTVTFSGYKGQNGKIVMIRHPNGYRTSYGHLWRIKKGIRGGVKVKQGQVIGYVGSTGLSTGPHLDYRIKKGERFVNPLTLKLPRGRHIPKELMVVFKNFKDGMDTQLTTINPSQFIVAGKE